MVTYKDSDKKVTKSVGGGFLAPDDQSYDNAIEFDGHYNDDLNTDRMEFYNLDSER